MKTYLFSLIIFAITLLSMSCSCGIYRSDFQASQPSQKIDALQVAELARDIEFHQKSKNKFKRDLVYLSYREGSGSISIGGSFCSLPHELLFSSPEKVEGQVLSAEQEVEKWFKMRGISLGPVPSNIQP